MASKEFSTTLKNLRLKAGFTQKQVYEHFGLPQSTFSSWEVGKSEPSGDMLIKLCEFYNCDMMKEFSSSTDVITNVELDIIEKYRKLDGHGQDMVRTVLDKEYSRCAVDVTEKENNIVELPSNDDHLRVQAAHTRTDIEVTPEMIQNDDDIMNDDSIWGDKI